MQWEKPVNALTVTLASGRSPSAKIKVALKPEPNGVKSYHNLVAVFKHCLALSSQGIMSGALESERNIVNFRYSYEPGFVWRDLKLN